MKVQRISSVKGRMKRTGSGQFGMPENLPEAVLRWEYEKSPAGCPMPEDAPDNLAAVQLLRLKAKVSARLHLHTEVRTIHARLGNKYQHIEELIKNIQP